VCFVVKVNDKRAISDEFLGKWIKFSIKTQKGKFAKKRGNTLSPAPHNLKAAGGISEREIPAFCVNTRVQAHTHDALF